MFQLKNLAAVVGAALLVLIAVTCAFGQSGKPADPPDSQSQDNPIKLSASEVLLNITVTDDYGHMSTGLSKNDFIIAEDGKRQDIESFAVASVPVNVVLLLDASGSVIDQIASLRDAADEFIKYLGPQDKVSIMEFHSNVELIQDWSSNQEELLHAVSWRFRPGKPPKRGGNTSLFDAIYLAANDQLAKVQGRKAIIILTDCVENSSKITYDQALKAVVHSGAVVYTVSKARQFIDQYKRYPGAGQVISIFQHAEDVMVDLSKRTGGRVISPRNDSELTTVYGQVAHELKNQYILTYIPKNDAHDGTLRHVNVYLARPGYAARTRESYYAPTS